MVIGPSAQRGRVRDLQSRELVEGSGGGATFVRGTWKNKNKNQGKKKKKVEKGYLKPSRRIRQR